MKKPDSQGSDKRVGSLPGDAAEFDFRHHLHDTIVLLGGKKEIADLLAKSSDGAVTEADVDGVRDYNVTLLEQTKTRLSHVRRRKVRNKRN